MPKHKRSNRADTGSRRPPKPDRLRVGVEGGRGRKDAQPGWALRELERITAEWMALTPGEALHRAKRLGLLGPLPRDPRAAALAAGLVAPAVDRKPRKPSQP